MLPCYYVKNVGRGSIVMYRKDDGVNVVRCIGLLLVFGFHFFLYNGYYSEPQVGFEMLIANAFRALCLSCNGIYMMLTGYLKSDKPVNSHYFKCIPVAIITYVFACAISIPIRHFILGQEKSMSEWLNALCGFSGVYYGWYIRMYIGLILISPILNAAIKQIKSDSKLALVTILLVMTTSFSVATPLLIFPAYWEMAYPLSYYMIGATIKRINPTAKNWKLGLIIIIMAFGTGIATLVSTDNDLEYAIKWEFGAVWIMIIAVCIFLIFYRAKLKTFTSGIVRFIANGSFPAYMLSNLTDAWIYKLIPEWRNPKYYIWSFIIMTIPSYLFWVTVGNGVNWIVKRITLRQK